MGAARASYTTHPAICSTRPMQTGSSAWYSRQPRTAHNKPASISPNAAARPVPEPWETGKGLAEPVNSGGMDEKQSSSSSRSASVETPSTRLSCTILSSSGIAPPDSHLLTAWRETPNASLNCSWDSPARLRKAAIFSDNGIKKARPFG